MTAEEYVTHMLGDALLKLAMVAAERDALKAELDALKAEQKQPGKAAPGL